MNEPLTYEEKCELYRAGLYQFPAPPVCHTRWTEADWIRYIDNCGKWTPRTTKEIEP